MLTFLQQLSAMGIDACLPLCYHAGIRIVCSIETGCAILPSKDREQLRQ